MGWGEFVGWLRAMKREDEAREVQPGSWEGAANDPWWTEARRDRDEKRRPSQ